MRVNLQSKANVEKKQNKISYFILMFIITFFVLFILTFRLPIIPSSLIKEYLSWLFTISLTLLLAYYLFFFKEVSGHSALVHTLRYRLQGKQQRIMFCLLTPLYPAFFYLIGALSVPIFASPSTFVHDEIVLREASIISITKASGWYRGKSKLGLKTEDQVSAYGIYWSSQNIEQEQLIEGDKAHITLAKSIFGTHIRAINKVN